MSDVKLVEEKYSVREKWLTNKSGIDEDADP